MTGKPKTKSYQPSTNPLKVLFSFNTPFEFVSKYRLDQCLQRLEAKRTKNRGSGAHQHSHDLLVVTVEISQDSADSAKFVIEYRSKPRRNRYYRKIEGRLERYGNMTFVQTNIPAFGVALLISVVSGLLVLIGSTGFILLSISASLWAFAACYLDRRDILKYIKSLFAYDAEATGSKAHPIYKTPKQFRLVDDGEVIAIDEGKGVQTSDHGSNSK